MQAAFPSVPLDAQSQFFYQIHQTPPLTPKDEVKLLAQLQTGGKAAITARDRLVEAYQPLVLSIAKRYVCQGEALELLDVVQEGNIGLLDALAHYDSDQGEATFSTWAFPWIRGAILRALWKTEHLISLPPRKVRQLQQFEEVVAALQQQKRDAALERHNSLPPTSFEPTLEEMAEAMDLSLAEMYDLLELRRHHKAVFSLDLVFRTDGQETYSLAETLADTRGTPEPVSIAFYHAWAQLPPKERLIMTLRLGLEDHDPMTQQEVAEAVGASLSVVQILDRRARMRLERHLRSVGVLKPAEALALTA